MATKQYIAIKKTPLTNIDQKLENSSWIGNLIKITLPMKLTLKNTIKYQQVKLIKASLYSLKKKHVRYTASKYDTKQEYWGRNKIAQSLRALTLIQTGNNINCRITPLMLI